MRMTEWRDEAACRGRTAEMAMPVLERVQGQRGGRSYTRAEFRHIERAKTICAGCPVLWECRAWALSTPDPCVGLVAGGLTPAERERHVVLH